VNVGEVRDFCLHGDETLEEIEGYADDYLSDIATEKAEAAAERKANQYDTDSLDMDLHY
jgi:predicted house-cleaning NTP pyrophosphatase (Maf/HAM1 superfamily)